MNALLEARQKKATKKIHGEAHDLTEPKFVTTTAWRCYPTIFEINTWTWLAELSRRYGSALKLHTVPAAAWDAIASMGFDAVWLMGVWERSPAGIAIANRDSGLHWSFNNALPDFKAGDNVGSPFCVRRYVVDKHLGGSNGLAIAREELATRGVKLILDLVANHVAPDHPWVKQHPEFFIHGTKDELRNDPGSYIETEGNIFACGRDPYFPAWPDVLQLNAFDQGLRRHSIEGILEIAKQCDGVRCDMAMLLINQVFERTWGTRAGKRPDAEYWVDLIKETKRFSPNFMFIAEAYWDLEWQLQNLGFDFCYDKKLYDRLLQQNAESVRLHLLADSAYQNRLIRFIENHDEPRAAREFSWPKHRAAFFTIATIPGAKLLFEGQMEGRKVRLPVFLGRAPDEPVDEGIGDFYQRVLEAVDRPLMHEGVWLLAEISGWFGNEGYNNLIAWTWTNGEDRTLIVVNLSESQADGRVIVPWPDFSGKSIRLSDAISDVTFIRSGDEIATEGLYVKLGAWEFHCFDVRFASNTAP
jgi:hypothetical protein